MTIFSAKKFIYMHGLNAIKDSYQITIQCE